MCPSTPAHQHSHHPHQHPRPNYYTQSRRCPLTVVLYVDKSTNRGRPAIVSVRCRKCGFQRTESPVNIQLPSQASVSSTESKNTAFMMVCLLSVTWVHALLPNVGTLVLYSPKRTLVPLRPRFWRVWSHVDQTVGTKSFRNGPLRASIRYIANAGVHQGESGAGTLMCSSRLG